MITARPLQTSLSALAALAVLALAVTAQAQDRRVIPYQGRLEIDGVPYTGDANMRFSIYIAGGGTNEWYWQETYSANPDVADCDDSCPVSVVDGHFEVWLGRYWGLWGTWPLQSQGDSDLVVGVEVAIDDGDWVPLLPHQPLTSAPVALWTAGVVGDLDVDDGLAVDGYFSVRGTASTETTVDASVGISADGAASGATVAATTMTVSGNHDLDVGGALTVTGDLTVDSAQVVFADDDVALEVDNGSLVLGDNTAAAVTVKGTTTIESSGGNLAMNNLVVNSELRSDTWRLRSSLPLYRVEHFQLEEGDISYETGISKADYVCWVGGVAMRDGDICEGSVTDCGGSPGFRAFTMPNGVNATWNLYVDFQTHHSDETSEALVVCVQARAVDFLCSSDTDGTGYYPAACPGEAFWFSNPESQYPGSWRQ